MNNISRTKELCFIEKEYVLCRYILNDTEKVVINTKCEELIEEIISDQEFQKWAISRLIDKTGKVMLNGIVTPAILIIMHELITPDILSDLLNNILFSYKDKEKNEPFMLTKVFNNYSYLELILLMGEYKFRDKFKYQIACGIIESLHQGFDDNLIETFFKNSKINFSYKEMCLSAMSKKNLIELLRMPSIQKDKELKECINEKLEKFNAN